MTEVREIIHLGIQRGEPAWLAGRASLPLGAYPRIGRFDPPGWLFTDEYPPERYRAALAPWRGSGATILGGCGTTPDHIAAIASLA